MALILVYSIVPSSNFLMHCIFLLPAAFIFPSNSHITILAQKFSPDDFFIVVDKRQSQRFASYKCTENPKLSPLLRGVSLGV